MEESVVVAPRRPVHLRKNPVCRKVSFFLVFNRMVKMSVLTEGFLKPGAHFVPSQAEVIHLANSVVVVQFNFRLKEKK